jgi:hypothetical protein
MRLLKFMIVSLLGVAITLTANGSWANEDITTDYSSLQDIDSTQIAKRFWDIKGEDIIDLDPSRFPVPETMTLPDRHQPTKIHAQTITDDNQGKLSSNYGDTYVLGDKFVIPLFTF